MSYIVSFCGIFVLVAAAADDIRERRIPNGLVIALASLGAVRLILVLAMPGSSPGLSVLLDVVVCACLFFVGVGLFAAGLLGGGDVKLLAAAALWIGWARLPELLAVTLFAGGILALFYLTVGLIAKRGYGVAVDMRLPYGWAIAAGGIVATTGIMG